MKNTSGCLQPGAILLVSCYELGRQPLGLASPLGFFQRAGIQADGWDLASGPLPEGCLGAADFVGISTPMHTALRLGVQVAERIRREKPETHICFYGLYALLNSDSLLRRGLADTIIGGEFEEPLEELVLALAAGRAPEEVDGVGTRTKKPVAHIRHLDYATPERTRLAGLEQYARLQHDGVLGLVGAVEASRGCKHVCRHCPVTPIYEGRFFAVPSQVVLEDVSRLVESGASHVSFADPDFLNGPSHALEIARQTHAAFPELTFDFTAKVEHILKCDEMLPELEACGCLFVVSAVESLSDTVLRNLRKGHTAADVRRALRVTRRAGITLRPSLLPFTPWSSLEDYRELLEFIHEEDLVDAVDPIQLSIRLLLPPGSALLSTAVMKPYLVTNAGADLSHEWRHPDPRMDRFHVKVSEIVETAARREEEPGLTHRRIAHALEQALGYSMSGAISLLHPLPDRRSVPRLTEPWFC